MNYTVPYNGTFCSRKPVKRKRTLSPEAKELRDFYLAHSERKPDGNVVIHLDINGRPEK